MYVPIRASIRVRLRVRILACAIVYLPVLGVHIRLHVRLRVRALVRVMMHTYTRQRVSRVFFRQYVKNLKNMLYKNLIMYDFCFFKSLFCLLMLYFVFFDAFFVYL